MASKVLVKIPTVPFTVNKKVTELAAIGRSEGLMVTHASDPLLRVTQLEQNIRFLQEQHQLMLASLHHEIEQLRHRNRDLQFQLVFMKGGVALVSSPSSPEDDSRPKILLSPKQFNLTPLQVEILERDITDLKATLNEAKTKNVYLSGIVEEQKKKLERNAEELQKLEAVGRHISPIPKSGAEVAGPSSLDTESESVTSADETGLAVKLEEAEKLIRRLRRENEEQKKELVAIKSNLSKSVGGGGGGGGRQLGGQHRGGPSGGNHHHHHRGNGNGNGGSQPPTHRFPPLHTQSYWHHGGHQQQHQQHQAHKGGSEFGGNRPGASDGVASCLEKENQGRPGPSLPNLRVNPSGSGYNYGNQGNQGNQGNGHQRRGGYYNGNQYYRGNKDEGEGGSKKYRGGRGGTRGYREAKE